MTTHVPHSSENDWPEGLMPFDTAIQADPYQSSLGQG